MTDAKVSPQDLRNFRAIVGAHRGDTARGVSRAGAIIRKFRKPYRVIDGKLVSGTNDLEVNYLTGDLSKFDLDAMKDIAKIESNSVGRIDVENSIGQWIPVGTAFRVSDRPTRMATARHILTPIIPAATSFFERSYPFLSFGPLRRARVVFDENDIQASAFAINTYVMAHPHWDLLLFDLEQSTDRPALTLEDKFEWGEETANPVAVIGFPMSSANEQEDIFRTVFGADQDVLKTKHLSPGQAAFVQTAPASFEPGTLGDNVIGSHDATTLPGSSGSPVISLKTRKVVGLHYYGGSLTTSSALPADPNRCVNIPVALTENPVRFEMADSTTDLSGDEPIVWRNPIINGSNEILPDQETGFFSDIGIKDAKYHAVVLDRPDFRDKIYEPPLIDAPNAIIPSAGTLPPPPNQGDEPTCVGFTLATAINLQLKRLNRKKISASARMLYETARLYDEWLDDNGGGTSLRGGIKGFFHSGVCSDVTAPYLPGQRHWSLSIAAAMEARSTTLGAYYRLRPNVLDYQIALAEVGAVVVSAHIHDGWKRNGKRRIGRIPQRMPSNGTHAFVLVGYDELGFLIVNSWGEDWARWRGQTNLAHWSYKDWADNLMDGWVLRLSPSTPYAFDIVPRIARDTPTDGVPLSPVAHLPLPRRYSLLGHSVHVERDEIVDLGRIAMGLGSIRETALYLRREGRKKYSKIAFFFHDPMLGKDTIARLCAHLIEPFKANGIYPLHVIYGLDEAQSIRLRLTHEASICATRVADSADLLQSYLENRAFKTCARPIDAFVEGCAEATNNGGSLFNIIASIALEAGKRREFYIFAAGMGSFAANACITASARDGLLPAFRGNYLLSPLQRTLPGVESQCGDRWTETRYLASQKKPNPELCGYSGDWVDLCKSACNFTVNDVRSSAIEHSNKTNPTESTIARACAEAVMLNDFLAKMLDRQPSKTRSFY